MTSVGCCCLIELMQVWSKHANKWLHVDSCECAIDAPLLYESGWGKKLSYAIAAGIDDMVDVTRRYTKKMHEVASRRTAVPEDALARLIAVLSLRQFNTAYKLASTKHIRKALLHRRHVREQRQMEANIAFDDGARRAEESIGRISGSLLWRKERHEVGGNSSATTIAHHQGWRLLSAAASEDAALDITSLSCFGSQLIALTASGGLMWQSIHSATSQLATWKPVHVLHQQDTNKTVWPPADHRLLCLAAESGAMQFFVISCMDVCSWLWKVTYTAGDGERPGGWIASKLHELCLPTGSLTDGTVASMVWACGRLLLLSSGVLWGWPATTADMHENASKVALRQLTQAEHKSALCASAGGAVLAFHGAHGSSAAAVSPARAASSIDILRQPITAEPRTFTLGDDCEVSVIAPAVLPATRLGLELHFQSAKAPANIEDDWLEIARVGQIPEADVAQTFDLVDSWPQDSPPVRQLAVSWPDSRLPKLPGLYEFRYFHGAGFRSLLGTSQLPLLVLPTDSCDTSAEGWVPVFPADNITAMCCSASQIIARTTSGEFWSIGIPPVLAHPPVSLQCSAITAQATLAALPDIGLSVQARVGIVFKQLTRGCGRSPGACSNPHCASFAGAVPLAPNTAAVEAIRLISSGDTAVYCPK
jgi:hypothetical protein